MPDAPLVPAATLGDLDAEAMAGAIRPLFEDSPWLAARLCGSSYSSWEELVDRAGDILDQASDEEKAGVLASHPRLGAAQEELRRRSETSWREQGAGRRIDDTVLDALAAANDRYEDRFGFPFVDWVAGRPLEAMIAVIDSRLVDNPRADPHADTPTDPHAGRRAELTRACRALVDIARDRLGKLPSDPDTARPARPARPAP